MALELVGGAVLGVLFDQFQKEIWRVKDDVVMFKPKLETLEQTLTVLYPVIEEIEELNRQLNRPNYGRETIMLRRLLEEGAKLVSKCSKLSRWDFLKRCHYREKLMELDNRILRFHNLYLQAHIARDQKQTLLVVEETRQMVIMMSLYQQEQLPMQMLVLKVDSIHKVRIKHNAMKVASGAGKKKNAYGISRVKDKEMTIVGEIDAVMAMKKLSWKLCLTEIVAVVYNKDEKKDAEANNNGKTRSCEASTLLSSSLSLIC